MSTHHGLGPLAATASNRFENSLVLVPGDLRLGMGPDIEPQIRLHGQSQPPDFRTQPLAPAERAHVVMKLVMPLHPCDVVVAKPAQASERKLEIVDCVRGPGFGRQPRGQTFEHGPHLEQFEHLFRSPVGDDGAAVRPDRHVALGVELADRFAHRHATDAQHLSERLGLEAAAARQRPGYDPILEMDVGQLLSSRWWLQHEFDPPESGMWSKFGTLSTQARSGTPLDTMVPADEFAVSLYPLLTGPVQVPTPPPSQRASPVYGSRGRIGLLVPANNSVIEPEFWSVLPRDVALYATRLLVKGDLTPAAIHGMERQLTQAVETIAATGVGLIAYCDMVTTFIMEPGWNEAATAKIAHDTGVPAISAWTSLRDALAALGVRRFALGTPYPAAIHATARPFFEAHGFTLTDDATLDILAVREVPTIDRGRLAPMIDRLELSGADAIVLLATDLPTFGVIAEFERATGLPVVTSNQALLWSSLRSLKQTDRIETLGKLFTM